MRAVLVEGEGAESRLHLGEAPPPQCGAHEVRIAVRAFAVNRGDLMQRRGLYPPPPGASPLLGLECAGEVVEVGARVTRWRPGARVMALLSGGGYAEQACAHEGACLPVPEGMGFTAAAAIPEVFLTVHLCVFMLAGFGAGQTLLVQGGGSGIGTAAIQLAKRAGGRVIATAGSADKCARCLQLGADAAVNYRTQNFAEETLAATDGRGADVALDSIGAPYLAGHLKALRTGGRLVLIGLMGGAKAELPLAQLLLKRLQIIGSTLRARPAEEKAALAADFWRRFGAAFASGALRPVVHKVFPMAEVEAAHQCMRESRHFGKLVLEL